MGLYCHKKFILTRRWSLWLVGPEERVSLPRRIGRDVGCFVAEMAFEVAKFLAIAVFVFLFLTQCTAIKASAATTIPRGAEQYRALLIRTAHATWGLEAPIAVFAAQVHTESRWNTNAQSPVGAVGLAQFMPATAKWMPQVDPALAGPAPTNPGWALRGLASYNLWLWQRVQGENDFERMAFVLSAYNGGLGWVQRDKTLAKQKGLNPKRWFTSVETVNAGRSKASFTENRNYPRLILQERQHAYVQAGWGRGVPRE
ncbi:transglycosylase SLT domain-containing protein [Desulfovibrio cuneatus]|uniref:transglycosylase SLT domain-containing protein n=1 Tax=Desulfovibrio cuneatus TaxID=159728 RepID=UPI0004119B06|nr:transglycosylase SLT domain-containing protein [Desulfovibrio cuneatus]